MFKNIFMALIFIALFGCSQDQPAQQTAQAATTPTKAPATAKEPVIAEHLLVFFLDPNGGPCRMQGDILNRMSNELDGKVLIRPVQTTVPADRDLFYAYGVRALPTILLADSTGKEIKRLSPGVQNAETIRGLLSLIPAE